MIVMRGVLCGLLSLLLAACTMPVVEQRIGPFSQSVGPGGVQQSAGPFSQSVGSGGVQQSAGAFSQSVGRGGVQQSADGAAPAGQGRCEAQCGGNRYAVSCPSGETPVCQCTIAPYASCTVQRR